ncbi:MAG TPA: HAD family hydrolase [Thermomicrobiales bacterium]|nr:HAD family hydrolase [Thermomicrobiales bacterium]
MPITHLLIDADDTLWENNIYFERATEAFVTFLNHSSMSREEVLEVLDDFERVNAGLHGYGSSVYTRSLVQTFQALIERDVDEGDLAKVVALGTGVLENEMELIPHVETTLATLREHFTLTMCTKGQADEQTIKIDRSGLVHYFHQVEVMHEKDTSTYAEVLTRLGVESTSACMIGNSPKSDIIPPLALGMSAIFIPHDHTWKLEQTSLDESHPQLTILPRFADLISCLLA